MKLGMSFLVLKHKPNSRIEFWSKRFLAISLVVVSIKHHKSFLFFTSVNYQHVSTLLIMINLFIKPVLMYFYMIQLCLKQECNIESGFWMHGLEKISVTNLNCEENLVWMIHLFYAFLVMTIYMSHSHDIIILFWTYLCISPRQKEN